MSLITGTGNLEKRPPQATGASVYLEKQIDRAIVLAASDGPNQHREGNGILGHRCDSEGEAMNRVEMIGAADAPMIHQAHWFALQTRPRHEKKVAGELGQKGVTAFLPLVSDVRQWSDRRVQVDLPLFSCYLFVNIVPTAECRVAVLQSYGALGFVGRGKEPIPVPESQIEHVRRLVASKVPFAAHPFLEIGQRVRIRGGALDGIEGILERRKGRDHLVLSVQTIQRSLSITVEGYDVEAIRSASVYQV